MNSRPVGKKLNLARDGYIELVAGRLAQGRRALELCVADEDSDNVVPFKRPEKKAPAREAVTRAAAKTSLSQRSQQELRAEADLFARTGLKAGYNVACIIGRAEQGGYTVQLAKTGQSAFLSTMEIHEDGDLIMAVFVCVHKGRIVVTELFKPKSRR